MNCLKCGKEIELIDLYAQNYNFFCRKCFEEITNKKENYQLSNLIQFLKLKQNTVLCPGDDDCIKAILTRID